MCVFFPLMSKLIIVQANSHSKCHEKSKVCNSNTFCHLTPFPAKGGFFSESAIRFLHLQISKKNIPKNYPVLEIWIYCLLLLAGNLNFKLRIVLWNIFFWDLDIWKNFIAPLDQKYQAWSFEYNFVNFWPTLISLRKF